MTELQIIVAARGRRLTTSGIDASAAGMAVLSLASGMSAAFDVLDPNRLVALYIPDTRAPEAATLWSILYGEALPAESIAIDQPILPLGRLLGRIARADYFRQAAPPHLQVLWDVDIAADLLGLEKDAPGLVDLSSRSEIASAVTYLARHGKELFDSLDDADEQHPAIQAALARAASLLGEHPIADSSLTGLALELAGVDPNEAWESLDRYGIYEPLGAVRSTPGLRQEIDDTPSRSGGSTLGDDGSSPIPVPKTKIEVVDPTAMLAGALMADALELGSVELVGEELVVTVPVAADVETAGLALLLVEDGHDAPLAGIAPASLDVLDDGRRVIRGVLWAPDDIAGDSAARYTIALIDMDEVALVSNPEAFDHHRAMCLAYVGYRLACQIKAPLEPAIRYLRAARDAFVRAAHPEPGMLAAVEAMLSEIGGDDDDPRYLISGYLPDFLANLPVPGDSTG